MAHRVLIDQSWRRSKVLRAALCAAAPLFLTSAVMANEESAAAKSAETPAPKAQEAKAQATPFSDAFLPLPNQECPKDLIVPAGVQVWTHRMLSAKRVQLVFDAPLGQVAQALARWPFAARLREAESGLSVAEVALGQSGFIGARVALGGKGKPSRVLFTCTPLTDPGIYNSLRLTDPIGPTDEPTWAQAESAFLNGSPKAMALYRALLEVPKLHNWAKLRLADLTLLQQDVIKAYRLYEQIRVDAELSEPAVLATMSEIELGTRYNLKVPDIARWLKRVQALSGTSFEVAYRTARALTVTGRQHEALTYLKTHDQEGLNGLRLKELFSQILYEHLRTLYLARRDIDIAESYARYRSVAIAHPQAPFLMAIAADALIQMDLAKEAAKLFTAINSDPPVTAIDLLRMIANVESAYDKEALAIAEVLEASVKDERLSEVKRLKLIALNRSKKSGEQATKQ